MCDEQLLELQYQADTFKNLNPVREYLLRSRIEPKVFTDYLLLAYGAKAPEHYDAWLSDATNHAQNGFSLAVIDQIDRNYVSSVLHLYAPHMRQINGNKPNYNDKKFRGISGLPKSILVQQTVETFFHYSVRLPSLLDKGAPLRSTNPEIIHYNEDSLGIPLLVNQVQVFPLGNNGARFARGPKHAMHVQGMEIIETHPSREIPVLSLQKPRIPEFLPISYIYAAHSLLKQMFHSLQSGNNKQQKHTTSNAVNRGSLYYETARDTVETIANLVNNDSSQLINTNEDNSNTEAVQDILFSLKMCAGWLATRKSIN